MVGNSLSAKDKYAGFEGQPLPQAIKATAAEFSRANKCLLTLKHGTVSSCQAKGYYSYDDSILYIYECADCYNLDAYDS
jgi:hypothetical protein